MNKIMNNINIFIFYYPQLSYWTTWTTWTRYKSVKKNIIFLLILNDRLICIIIRKKIKKIIFLFEFDVVHLVHLVPLVHKSKLKNGDI